MNLRLASDARPQVKTLVWATVLSVVLWFIPFAEFLVYPFRLFVTFIHEGGHVLASILTSSAVYSLTVSPDASGEVLSAPDSWIAALLISSAGYVGSTIFGALLLILIRRAVQARIVLAGTGIYIALLATVFGLVLPILHFNHDGISVFGMAFTLSTGFLIAAALLLISRFANQKVAAFFLSFLAIQCILNAIFDLKTVFFLSTPLTGSHVHTDAVNMYNATGVPSIFWVFLWIGVSVLIVSVALRVYAISRNRSGGQQDLPFED